MEARPQDAETPTGAERPVWTRADVVALALLGAGVFALYIYRLSNPDFLIFDESFYVTDACRYLHAIGHDVGQIAAFPASDCLGQELTFMHPPLVKWIIAASIKAIGATPFGWRLPSVLAGTATILMLYTLARLCSLSTRSAIVAAGFLALDPLHFVQSRIAMLDIFTTAFGVATIVCVRASIVTERRSWLIAAGVMGGVTAATKVPGALFVVLAIVLYMLWDRGSARWVRTRRAVVYLGLIPLVAFTALHIGVVDGHVFALPWSEGSWWRAFFERQADAVSYHLALDQVHSYQSPAWSWPLLRTPIAYMSAVRGSEGIGEVLAVGNPALWWPALIALLWLAFHPKGGGKAHPAAQAAVVGFAVTYLPWLFLGWARPAYLFYFVPTLPFMYLALATAVERLAHLAVTKHAIAVLVTAAVVFFGLYFPVMTASEIPRDRWRALMLFEDCDRLQGVDPDSPDYRPLTEVGIEPSSGWCWI